MAKEPFPIVPQNELIKQGERLRIARKARGMTQLDLAQFAYLSESTIKAMERGEPGVAIGAWFKVMDALGLLKQAEHILQPESDPAVIRRAVLTLTPKNVQPASLGSRPAFFGGGSSTFVLPISTGERVENTYPAGQGQ